MDSAQALHDHVCRTSACAVDPAACWLSKNSCISARSRAVDRRLLRLVFGDGGPALTGDSEGAANAGGDDARETGGEVRRGDE